MSEPTHGGAALSLLCRAGTLVCALPLPHVIETMRPLPIRPLGGTPPFVLGLSIIRGEPVPVVDAGLLFDPSTSAGTGRFVTIRCGNRVAAVAVEEVLGVRGLDASSVGPLPPLLDRIEPGVIALIGSLDASLLVVLRDGRIVPATVWDAIAGQAANP